MKIDSITAREILDSRGNPTVAATVVLHNGIVAEASIPSGASTGSREDVEIRDNDPKRYHGMGELNAVKTINKLIAQAICGSEVEDQTEIDAKLCALDGTKNKSKLGVDAILPVSIATLRAAALDADLELFEYIGKITGIKRFVLPTPMFNVLNGGKHAQNGVDIQETMVVPVGLSTYGEKLRAGAEIYQTLKDILATEGYETGLGDEGGFAPKLSDNEEVFKYVTKAISNANYDTKKVRISIDFAATELLKNNSYFLKNEQKYYSSNEMAKKISRWAKKYNLFSVEDGLSEDDQNWKGLTKKLTPAITIGDDLFTTDPERIMLGAKEKIASGVIIKPNQIGTVTETLLAIKKAQEGKMVLVVSHRSGETEDTFIADLAVGVGAAFIKSGAPARSERLAKYNRLSKIEGIISNSGMVEPLTHG